MHSCPPHTERLQSIPRPNQLRIRNKRPNNEQCDNDAAQPTRALAEATHQHTNEQTDKQTRRGYRNQRTQRQRQRQRQRIDRRRRRRRRRRCKHSANFTLPHSAPLINQCRQMYGLTAAAFVRAVP